MQGRVAAAMAAFCLIGSISLGDAAFAQSKPATIRMGNTTTSGEDQIWLMKARPDLTPRQGKDYVLETFPFRGGDLRFRAYQAGQVDAAVATGTGALTAATKGVPLVIAAALSEEDDAVYSSPYVVMKDSPLKSPKDLKGKTIGLNGLRESFELGVRMALLKAGLNPDRDVTWTVVPPVNMGDALRAGKIDLAAISQPFFAAEQAKGDVRVLFTVHTADEFKEEFVVFFNPDFIKANRSAVKAFLADFKIATKFYIEHEQEARKAIAAAKLVDMDPAIYLTMVGLKRKADGKPDADYLVALQKAMIRVGYVDKAIDLKSVFDPTLFEE